MGTWLKARSMPHKRLDTKDIYLGKFHHDLTSRPNPGIMVNKGNHPQMAELFRLVKYYIYASL